MIDLIIAYLALIVVILLFIIVFLTFYLIYDRRKLEMKTNNDSRRIVLPCLTLKSQDRSSGDYSNSASTRRTTKRLRYRPRTTTTFLRRQNSQGFLPNKLSETVIHFSNE